MPTHIPRPSRIRAAYPYRAASAITATGHSYDDGRRDDVIYQTFVRTATTPQNAELA